MKKAVGIHLQCDKPSAEERERLEVRAKAEIGEAKYRVRLTRIQNGQTGECCVRLDAIEL